METVKRIIDSGFLTDQQSVELIAVFDYSEG
jgi:hypothetical protein